ncbi:hypothetical protein [Roseateles sp. PN1]|uniref:hypothetical protein n=1 Tax=Roseateles sp. PN1 TaxID=3137372 RepID=UPI0031394595
MLARMMAFVVWGLLACSGTYWLIQLWAKPLLTPAQALPVSEQGVAQADLTRLFGAPAPVQVEAAPALESRFKLLGVVAPTNVQLSRAGEGLALIAVDGVARTVRVGAVLDGDLRLMALDKYSASFGANGVVSMTLQMAQQAPAATGALPPAQPSATNLGGVQVLGGLPAPPPMPVQGMNAPSQQIGNEQQGVVDPSGLPTR